jgi:hypothetical protein
LDHWDTRSLDTRSWDHWDTRSWDHWELGQQHLSHPEIYSDPETQRDPVKETEGKEQGSRTNRKVVQLVLYSIGFLSWS